MLKLTSQWPALLIGALLMATPAFSQDSGPLIDLLLKKGIVTDQEAEDLRAELVKDFAVNSPAGKLDLSSRVTRFALTGDVRVRYQYDNEIANNFAAAPATGPANDRSRYRYRIRLAPTVSLNNNWTVGMRFETAPGSTSTNDDFGAPGSHNFAKDGNTAFIGQAYLQYAKTSVFGGAIDAIDVRLGKHAHPFAAFGVNGFWIDTDINFEGLSEELRWTDVIAPGWTLAARAGQYLLANNSRTANRTGGFINHPSTLWIGQLEFAKTYLYENNPYGLRITPTVVAFTGPEVTGTTLNQADSATTTNYDNLLIAMLGFEYTVKANNLPLGIYGTYGYNLQGGQRANWLYSSSATAQVLNTAAGNPSNYSQMANFGLRYGSTRNPGDWQLAAEYRFVEPGAYTAILLDSDFNGGRTNGSGFIVSGAYNWTDAVTSTVTFFHSENVDKNSSGSVGYHRADVLQVDLSARF